MNEKHFIFLFNYKARDNTNKKITIYYVVWTRLTRVGCFNWLAHYKRMRIADTAFSEFSNTLNNIYEESFPLIKYKKIRMIWKSRNMPSPKSWGSFPKTNVFSWEQLERIDNFKELWVMKMSKDNYLNIKASYGLSLVVEVEV